ncbi:hypothetical protein [Geomesophilobacter sediminis]|uniref:Uncharacterized protein n=1 Tax=Geomesophilobacter sediminis TaxID=2798584 RepID=A0A8J7IMX1_9BACT|nr:hypothetical protein [Geomesophilobacter sediminis]MBJ6724308.1 hypothetical protein [Geomesophilobacter sediminis]
MTRAKSKAPIHKPAFEVDDILRFAEGENGAGEGKGAPRTTLTLTLKTEVCELLQAEAARKEKSVDRIVERLVAKHLGKH